MQRQLFNSFLTAALAITILLTAVGCQTTTEPITGRSQWILTSPDAEMRMGLQAWQDILQQEQPSPNQTYREAVQRVGNNLKKVIEQPGFEWEFKTFKSENANAFCLPGGKVAVYDGLFEFLANDAELAAVVGHEIAHAVARHGGERMTQVMMQGLGATALALSIRDKPDSEKLKWMAAYTGVTTVGVLLPYSRTHEYAADELGMIYMARAGYDPEAALSFWDKFQQLGKMPGILEFLSTHPVGEKRIERLREILPRAKLEYQSAPVKHGLGKTYK